MLLNINKDEAIQALETIIETQQSDTGMFGNNVAEEAQTMLNLLLQTPLTCDKIMLTEEEAEFIANYY